MTVLFDEVIKPLLPKLAEFMSNEFLPWLLEKLKQLRDYIDKNSDKIVEFLEKVGNIAWEGFKKFVDILGKLIDYIIENPDTVINFFKALIALKIASWVGNMVINVSKFVDAVKKLSGAAPGLSKAFSKVKGGVVKAATKVGSLVSGSGILTGAGATTTSGIALTAGMGIAGLAMAGYDAYKNVKRSEEIFGEEEGKTTSAKVTAGIGGAIGGTGGGLLDETKSAGEKAKSVGLNALKEWEEVLRLIRKYGYYKTNEALAEMNLLTRNAVEQLGWSKLCMSEDIVWLKKEFIEIFKNKQQGIESLEMLSEPVMTMAELAEKAREYGNQETKLLGTAE